MPGQNGARVVHRSPGRVRIRVEELRQDPELARRIRERLSELSGVTQIDTRPETGSILVIHEDGGFDEAQLARVAREADLFHLRPEAEARPVESRPRGAAVYRTWDRANVAVTRASGGFFDLRVLVPLALALWAMRQILFERPLVRTPWYTLLWYAFSLFTKFNPPPHEESEGAEVSG